MTNRQPLRRRLLVVAAVVAVAASVVPASAASAAEPYRHPSGREPPGSSAARVTQLPDSLLKTISTDRLAATVLDYPMLMDAMAFNNVQEGIEIVASRFNGLQELLSRPDSGEALLRRYQRFNPRVSALEGELAAGNHSWNAWKLEILLAQPQVLKTLSGQQLEKLLQVSREKYSAKRADSAVHGQAGLDHTAVLLGRALATREGWDYRQSQLLREAFAPVANAAEVADAVDRHFAEPAVTHAVSDGISTQDYNGTVYTPNGSAVTVIVTTYELTSSQITSFNNAAASQYPSATRLANASRRYNCHSYAWYWASSSNTYWMNSPGDDRYWQDGSYRYWHPPLIAYPNKKWSWVYGDHSGNQDGYSNYIRSKWGQWPQMYHFWNYSPYNDSAINTYYR